jgi:hypothetical protein
MYLEITDSDNIYNYRQNNNYYHSDILNTF